MATMTSTSDSAQRVQTIRLIDEIGADLSGRTLGDTVRATVDPSVSEVVFDCEGLGSMSPSFADEVFGKLAQESQRPAIRIVNATPDILALIRFAVQERSAS